MRPLAPLFVLSMSLVFACGGGKDERSEMVDLCLASCQRGNEVAPCGDDALQQCDLGCDLFRDESPDECIELGIDYFNCLLDEDVDWMCTEDGLQPVVGPCEELGNAYGACVFSSL